MPGNAGTDQPIGRLSHMLAFRWCIWLVQDSFLDEGFILDKKIGVGQPKRIENAKILVANTAMDTDKIKIYGARVRVDSMQKVQIAMVTMCRRAEQ